LAENIRLFMLVHDYPSLLSSSGNGIRNKPKQLKTVDAPDIRRAAGTGNV
jgi:hypothetical protein